MANTLKLPVGIENFEEIRKLGFYYIDKTRLIEKFLQSWGEVIIFTRPRRFGKTLNMSMLKSFFEIGTDKTLFDGLYISGNKELCDEYMGKYPVIFLSLKDVEGLEFSSAKRMLCVVIEREINRHYYLKTSDALNDVDKSLFTKMLHGQADNIEDSIRMLSQLLYKHYGQKVVILIDEY
ncbi:MAG: AAA family ATPase, partial [Lachnospiraceae bacterium]|nr:AAA family ATPase [Lachnospiraceae bacterium]